MGKEPSGLALSRFVFPRQVERRFAKPSTVSGDRTTNPNSVLGKSPAQGIRCPLPEPRELHLGLPVAQEQFHVRRYVPLSHTSVSFVLAWC